MVSGQDGHEVRAYNTVSKTTGASGKYSRFGSQRRAQQTHCTVPITPNGLLSLVDIFADLSPETHISGVKGFYLSRGARDASDGPKYRQMFGPPYLSRFVRSMIVSVQVLDPPVSPSRINPTSIKYRYGPFITYSRQYFLCSWRGRTDHCASIRSGAQLPN